jgi:hypothetical protein
VNLRRSDFTVYIGRAGRGLGGYFGNPIRVGAICTWCREVHETGGETLPCFESYARRRMLIDGKYEAAVRGLAGQTLGCFCKPRPCHGDVLARLCAELHGVEGANDPTV